MERKVIDLEIIDDLDGSGVDAIALVDSPAIEKNFMYFRAEEFVEPNAGESESDYMGRCVPYMIGEGKEQDQAVAICISTYENMGKVKMEINTGGLAPYTDQTGPLKREAVIGEEFAESYTDYPKEAVENARRAVAYAEENGWGDCGMATGKARASQLANEEPISEETIARMASFERHRQNSNTPYGEGCGKLMWDAWGGDAGIEWASRKLKEIRNEQFAESPIARIPKEERGKTGSDKNKEGDTKTSRGGIEVSQEVESTLKDKIKEHNDKNPQDSQKADLGMLKAVWRRGAGAYSVGTPGRRGMTRAQWAMGRVNAFLKILGGSSPSDKDYKQDNDLLPKSHPKHSEVKLSKYLFADEDKREIVAIAMVPDMEIPRKDKEGNIYFVKFSKGVIAKIAEKYMREQRLADTNIQHVDSDDAGAYVFESWIVETLEDKANSVYGLGAPIGAWCVKMRVTNPETWAKVKSGELKGLSIQGDFLDKAEYEAYMKDKKMYQDLVNLVKTF